MIVKVERPPNFDAIAAAFPMAHTKGGMFAYGDSLYLPGGGDIPPAIQFDHEPVHGRRQLAMGVDTWWQSYIDDPAFRLTEEILAHRAEYQWWLTSPEGRKQVPGFRSKADWMLIQIAQRLSGPLYGKLIGMAEAKRLIAS